MKINNKLQKKIDWLINRLFILTKIKLFGNYYKFPKQYQEIVNKINPNETIIGAYTASLSTYIKNATPKPENIKQLIENTDKYLDSAKNDVNTYVLKTIQSSKNYDEASKLLSQVFEKTNKYMDMLIANELLTAQNVAIRDGIVDISKTAGIDDPVVCKIGVIDGKICDNCKLLWHTEENIRIPKVYKLSELSTDYSKYKNPKPTIPPTHPHCRHVLVLVPMKYGFDSTGSLRYMGEDYDEYKKQRNL